MPRPIIVSDMDGTLSTAETWRGVHTWILANHPSPAARRFLPLRLPMVAIVRLGLRDREAFRARWQHDHARLLRGVPATELDEMGEWIVESLLWPSRRQAAVDALAAAVREARAVDPRTEVILATGAYEPIGRAFASRIGADVTLATPLDVRDGVATGGLAKPVQSGVEKADSVRTLAAGGEILVAFGDTSADVPLLALARRPIAVAPDPALRRVAEQRGWEILESA
ncbi:MAG TPA: haloacid dehalogenase-like hydrolase [Candidatus Deferrimicrobiaceae bacterium]|nr:haloacid dehalogenase-like hydrolase [Candidatus Deferrimicrobiaceae bacterium]